MRWTDAASAGPPGDRRTSEPLIDPLTAATRSNPRAARGSGEDPRVPPGRGGPPEGFPRRRPGLRRVKRTLRHVDPMSVLKLSLFFYSFFLILWLGAVAVVYWVLDAREFWRAVSDFSTNLELGWDEITLFWVERWAFLLGLTVMVVASLFSTFLAFVYNMAADWLGGVEMTFVERDA